jgi:transcriptional regulator with XRE-family HTH domain
MGRLDLAQVGTRIRQARRNAELTQEELADIVGVHKRTIENYERAQTKPFEHINEIAEATGSSVQELLHGEPAPTPQEIQELVARVDGLTEQFESLMAAAQRIEALLQSQANSQ